MATPVSISLKCPVVDKTKLTLQDLQKPWPGINNNRNGIISNSLTPTMSLFIAPEILMNETQRNNACAQRAARLIAANIIPGAPDASFFEKGQDENKLRDRENKIRNFQIRFASEYCHYESNYIESIKRFMTLYTGASANNKNSQSVLEGKNVALQNNLILNTLIAMMNYLSMDNRKVLNNLTSSLNGYNTNIQQTQDKLLKQAKILNSSSKDSEIFKQMVEYTAEKNRANQNMLSLYFTLNVIAIAGLFVIARNMAN